MRTLAALLKTVPASNAGTGSASWISLDETLIWIQSITDGIVHQLQQAGSCNFSDCSSRSDPRHVSAILRRAFHQDILATSKYVPLVQDCEELRSMRYICCRNAMLEEGSARHDRQNGKFSPDEHRCYMIIGAACGIFSFRAGCGALPRARIYSS